MLGGLFGMGMKLNFVKTKTENECNQFILDRYNHIESDFDFQIGNLFNNTESLNHSIT